MIKIENLETYGLRRALHGMRNPMNSHHKADTAQDEIGPNDLDLAKRLAKAGKEHRKYARQIFVSVDITAPLYWFKEFDTYKIGTTANSTSTMHKLMSRPLTIDDFSVDGTFATERVLKEWIDTLNDMIENYRKVKAESIWRGVVQLLPSAYNQTRTVTMNYEVVANMVAQRKNHKLSEWREFCEYMVKNLPHFKELFEDTEVMK